MSKGKLTMSVLTNSVTVKGDGDFTREVTDAVMPIVLERSIRLNAVAKGISIEASRQEHVAEWQRQRPAIEKRLAKLAARPKRARRATR